MISREDDFTYVTTIFLYGCLGILLIPILCIIGFFGFVAEAYVVRQWWEWFIIPAFGVRQINLFTFMAIIYIIRHFNYDTTLERKQDNFGVVLCLLFLRPLMFYGIGYVWFHYGVNILTNLGFSS